LHYNKVSIDPTNFHFERVKNWCDKWLSECQISREISDWISSVEKPRPEVAFGNVKKHKIGNPLRLITSCCGTIIERLSAFTEFYLKPLAQKLPSFVKDTTDFINRIDVVNRDLGPFSADTLLVSWDVVAMFPNIDNNLGISAAKKALDSRFHKHPSTSCILEAIEICLESNNSLFAGNHYVQSNDRYGPKKCL
jgi:hypothetical protein